LVESNVPNAADSPSTDHGHDVRQWLAEHGNALYAFALARVRSKTVAEDLVQDTLLAALQAAERFEGRASPRTWLIGILKHKVLDHLRRTGRVAAHSAEAALQQFVEERFDGRGIWRIKPGIDPREPASDLERAELAAALRQCLDKLPPRVAQAFLLVERDGRGADHVGQELGVSTTNVWTMMYRARIALRECLESTTRAGSSEGPRG
jgi:RNA polymerase sigma-70 factor (ECF subfamily)